MSSYAYEGSAGGPCTTNRVTGEHEHHYGSPGVLGLDLARPVPLHALRAAEARALERDRRLWTMPLVTDHGNPPKRTVARSVVECAAAAALEKLAQAHGFTTNRILGDDRVTIEGMHEGRRCGFRMTWIEGKADLGTWHEAWRYEYVHDTRAVKVDQTARVGLKNYRAAGVGEHHLALAASPWGINVGVTQIKERIAS